MNIRKATQNDLARIMELYDIGRSFMRKHGNSSQWGGGYPPIELVSEDIEKGICHVCEVDGVIEGVFVFFVGQDPTYQEIYDGQWLREGESGVVHRIVSTGVVRGIGSFCMQYAYERCGNVKIDTHADNTVMQGMLEKNGFTRCGIIHLADGSPRIAFQKI